MKTNRKIRANRRKANCRPAPQARRDHPRASEWLRIKRAVAELQAA